MSPDFIEGNTVFQNIKRLKIHRPIRRLKSQIIRICLFFPEKKDDPEPPSPTPIKRFNIRQLTKQCGMTYRGSENTMLGTGRQPFLVVVKINVWFMSFSKCSNWRRISKLLSNFGCLFTFGYLGGANSIKTDLHTCNI